MLGIFVIILMFLWAWLSVGVGSLLSKFFKRFTTNAQTGAPNGWHTPVKLLCIAFAFLLPFMDQLIAYPKWQKMCATTGDFEWGPGMDEKKAFGRELIVFGTTHETTIFPNIHVTYFSNQFKDAKTGELVLNMPHADYYKAKGLFYLPSSSGNNGAVFLSTCYTSYKSQKISNYLNQFNLKVVEDKS
jgi:hypothetical protein